MRFVKVPLSPGCPVIPFRVNIANGQAKNADVILMVVEHKDCLRTGTCDMIRAYYSICLVFMVVFVSAVTCGEAQAGDFFRRHRVQQNSSCENQPYREECMHNGISHGKPFGEGAVAVKIGQLEEAIHPARCYVTATRHGPFTTIR
jgi:hypothetical protein